MRRFWTTRWFRLLSGCLAVLCLVALSTCWYFRIWSYEDYRVYLEVRRYPAGGDLWFGQIKAGEDLDRFTAAHPPHRAHRLAGFTVLTYFSVWPLPPQSLPMYGLRVIAKDGRLVDAAAGGCTWQRVFFQMRQEDEKMLDEAYQQHWQERSKG